jgi:hypothetical protein
MLPQAVFHRVISAHSAAVTYHVRSAGTLLFGSAAMAFKRLSYGRRRQESQCQRENVEMLKHGIFPVLIPDSDPNNSEKVPFVP